MKKTTRKLIVRRATIQVLHDRHLVRVGGGDADAMVGIESHKDCPARAGLIESHQPA